MRISRYLKIVTVLIWSVAPELVLADRSALTFDGDISAARDNNINLAAKDADVRKDNIFAGGFNTRYVQRLSNSSGLQYSALSTVRKHGEFDGLDEFTIAGDILYRFRFGGGFTSSTYSVSAFAKERFSKSIIRDSTTIGLTAKFNKPLTDAMNMLAGIGYTTEEAEGDVFDLQRLRLFANLDIRTGVKWTTYITYVLVDGDVVSTGTRDINIGVIADAIEPDDAFGGLATQQFAYRIDALSHLLTLGFNWQLSHGSSLDFSARYLTSTASKDNSINYDDVFLRTSYLFAF